MEGVDTLKSHLIIPDTQVKPGVPLDHLNWIGQWIVEKKPDVVVHLGDHADMPSLSTYDKGKKSFEGRRVKEDIEAAKAGMWTLLRPWINYNAKRRRNKEKLYKPEFHITLGNHEDRITRAIELQPELEGLISLEALDYERFWTVHPFKEIAEIDGVHYAHYFYNPMTGRPFGGESIATRLKQIGFTFTMGHQQGYKMGSRELNNGDAIRGLVAGSCYLHDEDYIGPQGNGHWRGIIQKNEVWGGRYDLVELSLDYLCRRYEGMPVCEYMQKHYPRLYAQSPWLQRLTHHYKEAS